MPGGPATTERRLSGRRMVVTGAARGLGRALAIVAADWAVDLVLMARSAEALGPVADAIASRTGRRPMCVPCDLARPSDVASACESVLSAAPRVDVLVNNGAPWLPGTTESVSPEQILEAVGATVSGTILLTRGLLPGLKASSAADVVTIVSTAGLLDGKVSEASAVFHAAKHGQAGFSDRLREELRNDGIRVTAIYPPDFDDADPLGADWGRARDPRRGDRLTNREVIETIRFAIAAPRTCAYPRIVMENTRPDGPPRA